MNIMRLTKKYVTSFLVAVALLATACQKDELVSQQAQTSNRKIEVKACVASDGVQNFTRSAIVGTAVPTDRNLVMSAYFNNSSDGERGVTSDGSCDYFKDVKFAFDGNVWISEENSIYWPLTGNLDFLAYSAEQNSLSATWGDEGVDGVGVLDCSKKVVLSGFNASQSALDDVLYGAANNLSSTSTAVPMEFRHAKALIVFTAKANYDDAITITDIEMGNISSVDGGLILEVENNVGGISATWKSSAIDPVAMDVSVPGINSYPVPIKAMDVTKKAFYCGIGGKGFMVYGGHRMTSFTVTFTQTAPNGQRLTKKFTYDCRIGIQDGDPQPVWQAGKRYIYELDFDLQEISVTSQVNDWSMSM